MLLNLSQWWVITFVSRNNKCSRSCTYYETPHQALSARYFIYGTPIFNSFFLTLTLNWYTVHIFLLKAFLGEVFVALLDALHNVQVAESNYVETRWRNVSLPIIHP